MSGSQLCGSLFLLLLCSLPQSLALALDQADERWVEVKFARAGRPLNCRTFHLEIRNAGEVLVSGDFRVHFQVDGQLETLSRAAENLDVRIRCGRAVWVFPMSRVLLVPATWTFGVDYPPYALDWQIAAGRNTAWIKYFRVNPADGAMETHEYKTCPQGLLKTKSGPCFDRWR
jgi:hypothetical protein